MSSTLFLALAATGFSPAQVPVQKAIPIQGGVILRKPIAASPAAGSSAGQSPATSDTKMKPVIAGQGPPVFEVHTVDESVFRAVLLESQLELTTTYGPLVIPCREIRRIDVGIRITPEEQKRIDQALTQLTGPDRKDRVAGREAVVALGEKAIPSIRRIKRSVTDPEVLSGLTDLESRLLDSVRTDGRKDVSDRDSIVTDGSTFVGRLTVQELRVQTQAFGEQKLKITDLRLARSLMIDPVTDDGIPITDLPPNGMIAFQGQFGKVYKFRITANPGGAVWGTNTYTLDSYLPAAAVHAGALKAGETGVVKVRMIQSPNIFVGSQQNGVMSNGYGQYPSGAYEIITK